MEKNVVLRDVVEFHGLVSLSSLPPNDSTHACDCGVGFTAPQLLGGGELLEAALVHKLVVLWLFLASLDHGSVEIFYVLPQFTLLMENGRVE